ncbi:MAG: glycogen/starch/alpha-glucan phosphorylase [Oscillospiraceae bacterium]|nr:glycogen/starch/alpha-glucan phosphorylase [Oscillospiraceae bacterium]
MPTYTKQYLKNQIARKLHHNFGREISEAAPVHVFKASALVLRDILSERQLHAEEKQKNEETRQVHYLSLEFLLGRSLMKNAFNLGVLEPLTQALAELGFSASDIFETEPDAGLGNGGLGRLAACYLDSMTTLGIPATGYSICYELGIFKQKIIDGRQAELADNWLDIGDVWLIPKVDEVEEVRFGGVVEDYWENGCHKIHHRDYSTVLAVPRDMEISGFHTRQVNLLRLWDAKCPVPADMSLYSRGEYLKAVEQQAMAEVIAKVLYPDDHHYEGKSLRLKQQYFFVSATVQSIVRQHRAKYGTLKNFHQKHVIQINDTHPALVIPELMRILLDEDGYGWEEAYEIVRHTVAYTNHTILSEALERWPQDLIAKLLPRIWTILCELNRRNSMETAARFGGDMVRQQELAIIWGGEVRMANLCVSACFAVNGVSALHTGILKQDVFKSAFALHPDKFLNVTNGIDHRRWLSQSNPRLDRLIRELIGSDEYLLCPQALSQLEQFSSDTGVLARLGQIKLENKREFAAYMLRQSGVRINPDTVFDVQVKRLHEYKRQLLNVLHILYLYDRLHSDAHFDMVPRTFFFGAKAAPGYLIAKEIIQLICNVSAMVNGDPVCKGRLEVVFLENYRVSLAEKVIPAAEVSEQISTAGKEASGTGNMKFMMNGALTIGTLDGANVEMHEAVGGENMFLFGLTARQVADEKQKGYNPYVCYSHSESLKHAVDALTSGLGGGRAYPNLVSRLLFGNGRPADEYMLLADFESYKAAHEQIDRAYRNPSHWNQMALMNIARSGVFSADRSIAQYADRIWKVPCPGFSPLGKESQV